MQCFDHKGKSSVATILIMSPPRGRTNAATFCCHDDDGGGGGGGGGGGDDGYGCFHLPRLRS